MVVAPLRQDRVEMVQNAAESKVSGRKTIDMCGSGEIQGTVVLAFSRMLWL